MTLWRPYCRALRRYWAITYPTRKRAMEEIAKAGCEHCVPKKVKRKVEISQ